MLSFPQLCSVALSQLSSDQFFLGHYQVIIIVKLFSIYLNKNRPSKDLLSRLYLQIISRHSFCPFSPVHLSCLPLPLLPLHFSFSSFALTHTHLLLPLPLFLLPHSPTYTSLFSLYFVVSPEFNFHALELVMIVSHTQYSCSGINEVYSLMAITCVL